MSLVLVFEGCVNGSVGHLIYVYHGLSPMIVVHTSSKPSSFRPSGITGIRENTGKLVGSPALTIISCGSCPLDPVRDCCTWVVRNFHSRMHSATQAAITANAIDISIVCAGGRGDTPAYKDAMLEHRRVSSLLFRPYILAHSDLTPLIQYYLSLDLNIIFEFSFLLISGLKHSENDVTLL